MIDITTKIKIQKTMNKCFNLITHQTPTPANLCKEGILTLNQLITLENQKLGYKLYNNMLPSNILRAFSTGSCNKDLQKQHKYNTRFKSRLNTTVANSKLYHTSFLMQALKAYGKLPKEISLSNNIETFTMKCKAKLLQQN